MPLGLRHTLDRSLHSRFHRRDIIAGSLPPLPFDIRHVTPVSTPLLISTPAFPHADVDYDNLPQSSLSSHDFERFLRYILFSMN